MLVISIIILVTYFVLIAWTWQCLESTEKIKKTIFIILGIVICYLITLVLFNLSKNGIDYQNVENEKIIKRILTLLFTAINGIIFIPNIAKLYIKIRENNIKKEKVRMKLIILFVIFIICTIFECEYLKNMQIGIVNVYNKSVSQQQNNT